MNLGGAGSNSPASRQVLILPDDVTSPPQERGMSGRFLSGDTPPARGAGGNSKSRVPPKRSSNLQPPPLQPLPVDPGPFDLYGALDTATTPTGAMMQMKPSPTPRRLQHKTPGKLAMKATPPKGIGKPLKRLDSNTKKSKKLPSAKPVLPDIASQYDRMLTGYLDNLPNPQSSIVRIFLSSTFSDFKTERNYLILNAYPVLRQYCQDKGFDFQVVDLRWGITDSSSNDHTVENLCLNEIANCQHLSPGPNFVTMLGNRYGFRPIPTTIPVGEFEMLCRSSTDKDLLTTWYKLDENVLPPAYILQVISSQIPHFLDDSDEIKRKEANATWKQILTRLHQTLWDAAVKGHAQGEIDEERLHVFCESVTEMEVEAGLLRTSFPDASCCAFLRDFRNVELTDKTASRFNNTKPSGEGVVPDTESNTLMTSLRKKIKQKLASDNSHSYSIPWRDGGILPDDPDHASYLSALSNDFTTTIKSLVDEQVTRNNDQRTKQVNHVVTIPKQSQSDVKPTQGPKGKTRAKPTPFSAAFEMEPNAKADIMRGAMSLHGILHDHKAIESGKGLFTTEAELKVQLHADILHHLNFCKRRCAVFCGRQDELGHIQQYLTSDEKSPPLVVTSPPGGGKTSFIAKVAQQSKVWLGEQAVVIVRFLGSSPQSSGLVPLLGSICAHISLAYGETLQTNLLPHVRAVEKYFVDLLTLVSLEHGSRRPLVILLDSIEGLAVTNRPYLLHWLPKQVPPNVKVVISLSPEVNNGLEHACSHLEYNDTFLNLHLQPLNAEDAKEFIVSYPQNHQRKLTEKQQNKLILKSETLPPPILLKLWLDEACMWKSYTTELMLPGTLTDAVNLIFNRLEQKFGSVFVSAALGYLTLCFDGISEIELEDALSANDEVMDEVYRYHNPPLEGIIRIPPLMCKRMHFDLQEYLVQNETPGRIILSWYYSIFGQVAREKYAMGDSGMKLHAGLAKIFLVEDRLCSTVVLKQRKLTAENADRLVNPQKLSHKNRRKLMAVTYHLSKGGDAARFKEEVICNLRFLNCLHKGILNKPQQATASAWIWQVLENIDEESTLVTSALRLARPLIAQDLDLLPVQLLGQLISYSRHYKHIAALCKQAEDALKSAETRALVPLIGSVGALSSPANWYFEGPTRIIEQSQDGSMLLVGYGGRQKSGPLFRIFDVNSCQITHTIWRTKSLLNDILYSGVLSRNNRRAYLLCKNHYILCSILDGGKLKMQATNNNVNGAGSLHECIVASSNDKMFLLAGPSRLAMFEDTSASFEEPEFRARRAMNFSGAKATTNIIFTDDETGSISSHTVQGQKRVIGAINRWTFSSEDPCEKLPLPEPIPPGCLRRLPGMGQPDCVLVACADGKLYVICMSSCSILLEMKNSVGLRGNGLLLDLHRDCKIAAVGSKEKTVVALFDITEEKMTGHVEVSFNTQAVRFGPDENHLTVLRRDGNLKVFQVSNLEEKCSILAHDIDATSLFCPDDGHILTCAYDKTLKQFDLRRLLSTSRQSWGVSEEDTEKMIEYADVDTFCVVDDTNIITGNQSTSPKVWSLESGQDLTTLQPTNTGSGVVSVVAKGTRILSFDHPSKIVRQWEWPSGQPIKVLPGVKDVLAVAVSEDGQKVVFVCEHTPGTMIFLYNPCANEEIGRIMITDKIPKATPTYLTKDARYLVFVLEKIEKSDDDKDIKVLGALTTDLTRFGDQDTSWVERDIQTVSAINPNLFVLNGQGEVVIWQPPKTAGLYDMKKYRGWLQHKQLLLSKKLKADNDLKVTSVTVSPDDNMLVTAAEDGTLGLWNNILKPNLVDKMTGVLLKKHTNMVISTRFSRDSKYFASGSTDKTIIVWDASSGDAIAQMHTHARVMDISFLPGGKKIVARLSGAGRSHLAMWELRG